MKTLFFNIFLILFFLIFKKVESQIPLFTNNFGYFDDTQFWSSNPSFQTSVGLSNPNGTCIARYPVNKGSIFVGYVVGVDKNITFIVESSMSLSDGLIVRSNNTVHFDSHTQGDEVQIAGVYLESSDSILLNTGAMSGKNTYITNSGQIFNNGTMNLNTIVNKAYFKSYENTLTQLSNFTSGGNSFFSGSVNLISNNINSALTLKSNSKTLFNNSNVVSNMQNILIGRGSSFNLSSSIFSQTPYSQDVFGIMDLNDISTVLIADKSTLELVNTTLAINDYTNFNISNSNMFSNSNIKVKSISVLEVKDSSYLSSRNLLVNDRSQVIIKDKSTFESINLILSDNTTMNVENESTINVGIRGSDSSDSGIELPDNTYSLVGLTNNTNLNVSSSSNLIISGSFGMVNNSNILLHSSTMSVTNLFRSFDKASIKSLNTSIEINDEFGIFDQSTFSFENSSIDISGSFNINSNIVNGNLERQFLNSEVKVDGKIYNLGKLTLSNSKINLNKNLTTLGLMKSSNTEYSILIGQFNVYGIYDGSGDNITLNNGQMNVGRLSTFNCENCSIDSNGSIKQFKSSKVNLLSSTFTTNSKGNVVMQGDFSLDVNSKLSNLGEFLLETDIQLNDNRGSQNNAINAIILNHGNFTINNNNETTTDTVNTTNIYINFENRGILNLQKNVEFKQINQFNGGSISIKENIDIKSNETIQLNGGNIFGNGSVTTSNLNNNNAVLGDLNYYQLSINGNYNQGSNGTMIITIDSIDSISKLNINGNANINGTLIVRMNKNMVEDSSNYNKSMTIMQTNSMEGSYNNVQFRTYDPSSGEETDESNNCSYQLESSSTSFAVLLSDNSCNSKDRVLTTPQIIGIAIGGFAFIMIGALVVSYFVFTKYRYSERSLRLKKFFSKIKN